MLGIYIRSNNCTITRPDMAGIQNSNKYIFMSEQYLFKNVQLSFFVLYSLEEFLGNGQFGSVSKATWTTPGGSKKVAVKIMRPSVLDTTRVKFLQEAAIMGQFFHSNVVKLHGVVSVGEPVSCTNVVPILWSL